jgi:hypothetical protein
VTRRKADPPGLTFEQKLQRFLERERRDFEVWPRLTPGQRRMPYWRQRERQWQNAGKLGLILHLAGDELPEPLARALAPLQAPAPPPGPVGSPSGLFASCLEDVRHRDAEGTPWGSAWGSRWPRPAPMV